VLSDDRPSVKEVNRKTCEKLYCEKVSHHLVESTEFR